MGVVLGVLVSVTGRGEKQASDVDGADGVENGADGVEDFTWTVIRVLEPQYCGIIINYNYGAC